jgi:hypothetical protein
MIIGFRLTIEILSPRGVLRVIKAEFKDISGAKTKSE